MSVSIKDTFEIVMRSPLFQNLEPSICSEIIDAARPFHVASGEYYFHQGEPATSFYILVKGQVKLTQITPEGHQIIIKILGPGDGMGIIVALSGMDYLVAAEVVEDSLALGWNREVIRELMLRYPQLALNSMELIARRFAALQARLHEMATRRVEQRVARALLQLVRQFGEKSDEGVLINMPLSRQDLAEMTGTNLYQTSRILSKWEQAGYVQTNRKRVILREPHQLVTIAEDLSPR
ncbi:hypothetical protein MNBD_CHLOROFLEXI01-2283 [hydrothermal vent metagenome]|uniref:Crp/Fnr family transcriptional regulator n=1 Tax=hydrothermal vent metagenome TaxID=652676 RepID=A0A3B0VI74_9ZZZZ